MQRTIRRTLLAMALVALGANGTALAQPVADTLLSVGGAINNDTGTPSVDVYSFVAGAGDVITIDINTSMFSELDTVLSVVDPHRRQRDDLGIVQDDPTSVNQFGTDSYVQFTVTADAAGPWQVSVSANPRGGVDHYDLLVTRVKQSTPEQPEYMAINIDIKPENRQKTTPIKKGERHIRVALLSNRKRGFDPFDINVHSLRFGPTGDEESHVRCAKRGKDRNGDRKPDRVCRFDISKAGFTLMNTRGFVKGKTRDGKAFQGEADVKVLAQKHHHKHHGGKHHDDDDDDDD
jgi:hypothetical protein